MKKIIIFTSLSILLCTTTICTAQSEVCPEDLSKLMLQASTTNSTILWDKAIAAANANYKKSNLNSDLANLCYAYYGAVGNCIGTNDSDQGKKLLELGQEAAIKLEQDEKYKSLAKAVQGGLKGLEIAFSPMKGMMLGPESDRLLKESLKLEEENAFAWLQKGSSEYNTPKIFGGDVPESIKSFKKSIECFDKIKSEHTWLKLEAMIWLGQAYHYSEKYEEAKQTYEEVLKIAPGHQWVENSLLPKTEKKINQ